MTIRARSRRFRKSPPYRAFEEREVGVKGLDRSPREANAPSRKPSVSLFDGTSPRSTVVPWPSEDRGDTVDPARFLRQALVPDPFVRPRAAVNREGVNRSAATGESTRHDLAMSF